MLKPLLQRVAQRIAPAVVGIALGNFGRALIHCLLGVGTALVAHVVGVSHFVVTGGRGFIALLGRTHELYVVHTGSIVLRILDILIDAAVAVRRSTVPNEVSP